MANQHDATARFFDVVMGRTTKGNLKCGNILTDGDRIYSYGRHFEMARLIRDKKGAPSHWIVNGERYSTTTSQHQAGVRHEVGKTGLPKVVIPYGALRAAGITDLNSITILDDQPERNVVTQHDVTVMPDGAFWGERIDYVYRDCTEAELDAKVAQHNAGRVLDYANALQRHQGNPDRWPLPREPKPVTRDNLESRDCSVRDTTPTRVLWANNRKNRTIDVVEVNGVTHYRWETSRHWLGESLVSANVTWTTYDTVNLSTFGRPTAVLRKRRAKFLSGFDHQEARMSYFFCELPRTKATTVAEAYEALKPKAVLLAEANDRPVFRQGDIFVVQMTLDIRALRKAGATFTKRGTLLGTNHEATMTAVLPDGTTLARGSLYHVPSGRRPDHARITLAKGAWCLVVKNTVPLARTAGSTASRRAA